MWAENGILRVYRVLESFDRKSSWSKDSNDSAWINSRKKKEKKSPRSVSGEPLGFVGSLSIGSLRWQKAGCHLPAGKPASVFFFLFFFSSQRRKVPALLESLSLCRSEIRGHSSLFPLMQGARQRLPLPWCNTRPPASLKWLDKPGLGRLQVQKSPQRDFCERG